jgi:alpha-N-arabinofuranosidase
MTCIRSFVVLLACGALMPTSVRAQRVYHVAMNGQDNGDGSTRHPLRTISRAAVLAQAGDTITVSAGIYRERVSPPRGGTSEARRIVYQAAAGEHVEIRGSEVVRGWRRVRGDLWRVGVPNAVFGDFNPYREVIHGDWFNGGSVEHHPGEVYVDGRALLAAARLEALYQKHGDSAFWFAGADSAGTTIWAEFVGVDPNRALVEATARRTVFYPDSEGINYVTVRGFTMKQAATPWAPPTAEQVGLIGPHWSRGWIIEGDTISDARNACVSLGKYGDEWDNRAGSAEGYVGTVRRAIAHGWSGATVGHHVVRNNLIFNCGQAGIVGSLGGIFSTITGNVIHDINVHQFYSGSEVAGIKLHGAIDVVIAHNQISKAAMGIWLDWMAQGARVEGNLLHDNVRQDLEVEVNHGPFLVGNNVMLSRVGVLDLSEGGAFVHNLIAGTIVNGDGGGRSTPYFAPHSAAMIGVAPVRGGEMRYYNNIFARDDALRGYERSAVTAAGNVYLAAVVLTGEGDSLWLHFGGATAAGERALVTTALLGVARVPNEAFEDRDGSPLVIDRDYFGARRPAGDPVAGPFAGYRYAAFDVRVWPR